MAHWTTDAPRFYCRLAAGAAAAGGTHAMHSTSPAGANLLYLLIIPLIIWIRIRRARRAAITSDLWFEAEGDHYIYHPFGHYGAAYLVSPATRDAIRARQARLGMIIAGVFVSMAAFVIVLRSFAPDVYDAWLPLIVKLRIVTILTLIFGGLALRIAIVRPLYRSAALAPRRISRDAVRSRSVAMSSWWGLGLGTCVLGLLAAAAATGAILHRNAIYGLYASVIGALAVLNLRRLILKWTHRRVVRQAEERTSLL
jgi:hypothetical protein